jgi:hypothetical protein
VTTTLAEPEWDEETRSLVLAYDAVDMCQKCGRPASICQAAEHQFDWVADDPIRCHATTAVLARQAGFSEETHPQIEALMWPVWLRDAKR